MKKIESTSVEYLLIMIILIAAMGMILWPLLDLFIAKVITHSEFVYSLAEHVIEPIVFGVILGLVFWSLEKKKIKKK